MNIRCYDERYYLSIFGINERYMIKLWKQKSDKIFSDEMSKYSSLAYDYDSYIEVASKLVSELSIKDNSISKASVVAALIEGGTFSNANFIGDNCDDVMSSKLGINVLNGKGCCRNVSNFMTDIFSKTNEPCDNLPVVLLDSVGRNKVLLSYARNISLSSYANHMINLIHYEGVPYGFDLFYNTGSLHYFISEFELLPIDESKKTYMHFKPYIKMVYENDSLALIKRKLNHYKSTGRKNISQEEFLSIVKETDARIQSNIDLVKDFMLDTKSQIEEIREKIKEMKK